MPVTENKLYCSECTFEQQQINLLNCEKCGHNLGAPNVNEVSVRDERNALDERYNIAKHYAQKNGLGQQVDAFELYFVENVRVVINLDFAVLKTWLLHSEPYRNYYKLTEDGNRLIARPEYDRKRTIVDSYLFGTYGRNITYAALSLDNSGLISYGNSSVVLEDSLISLRTSFIEENSYNFVKNHVINLEEVVIPKGYRAVWDNKQKLSVAKLSGQIQANSDNTSFRNFVLHSDGNRENDEFIEAHVFNELSHHTIKKVFIPTPFTSKDQLDFDKLNTQYPGKVFVI